MKRPSCKKDWDKARRVFPYDKKLWLVTNPIVAKKMNVSVAFIQRLRVEHGIPFADRIDRLPKAEIARNEKNMIESDEFGEFRGFSNKSQPWLSARFNVPISRVGVIQKELNIETNPSYISKKLSRTVAPKGCADLMVLMHTWICQPMFRQ